MTLFLSYIIFFYYETSKKNKLKLSFQREMKFKSYLSYKINDENSLDISLCIVYLYCMFFILLMFICRWSNIDKLLDLKSNYVLLQHIYNEISLIALYINMPLLLCLCILYIIILSYIMRSIKKHMYKLYFYFFLYFHDNFYQQLYNIQNYLDINYYTRNFLDYLCENIYKKDFFSAPFSFRFIFTHVIGLQYIFHCILLFMVILYDLFFNHMLLTHMFKILPFVFIYELWVRISIFLRGTNFNCDAIIANMLYSEITEIEIDKKCLYIEGIPYEKEILRTVITVYARNGFIDKNFLPRDPIKEDIHYIWIFWKDLILENIKKYASLDIMFTTILLLQIIFSISIKYLL
jgi:hypothetical protein